MGTRINEYPNATALAGSDRFIVDGAAGTRSVSVSGFIDGLGKGLGSYGNVSLRNTVIRGNNLGVSFTNSQKNAIKNGSFDDLFLGDYWVDSLGTNWIIAGFNHFSLTSKNSVVLVSDTAYSFGIAPQDDYANSPLRKAIKDRYSAPLKSLFGDASLWSTNFRTSSSVQAINLTDFLVELIPDGWLTTYSYSPLDVYSEMWDNNVLPLFSTGNGWRYLNEKDAVRSGGGWSWGMPNSAGKSTLYGRSGNILHNYANSGVYGARPMCILVP